MTKPLHGSHHKLGDKSVLACTRVEHAMREQVLALRAADDEALDDVAVLAILLQGCVASCIVRVVELLAHLDTTSRDVKVVEADHRDR